MPGLKLIELIALDYTLNDNRSYFVEIFHDLLPAFFHLMHKTTPCAFLCMDRKDYWTIFALFFARGQSALGFGCFRFGLFKGWLFLLLFNHLQDVIIILWILRRD